MTPFCTRPASVAAAACLVVLLLASGPVHAGPVGLDDDVRITQSSGRILWRRAGDSRARSVDSVKAHQNVVASPTHDDVQATSAYVLDLDRSIALYGKNENQVRPIASVTKLMSALVVLDGGQSLNETVTITRADAALPTRSRLAVGTRLRRSELLHLVLMSSENRATQALARSYPGGVPAFVAAMNRKAATLGMHKTRFADPTGLSNGNVSSPHDLVKLMLAAEREPLMRRYSTADKLTVRTSAGYQAYRNTNALVGDPTWDVRLSKTGYTRAAGRCLVMLTRIDGRRMAFVLLGSTDAATRIADSLRLRHLAVSEELRLLGGASAPQVTFGSR